MSPAASCTGRWRAPSGAALPRRAAMLAAQIGGQFRHAVRAHRRQRGIEPQRQQRPHLLQRALPQHRREPAAIAARSASRGGSSRIAANRHGAARPAAPARRRGRARCRARPPRLGRSRWLSFGRNRAAVAGSTCAQAAHAARPGPVRPAAPRASARAPGRDRGSRPAHRSARRNTCRCRRTGSAAALPPAPRPSPPAPSPRHQATLPGLAPPGGRRTAGAARGASSAGLGRAVRMRSSRYTCMESALMTVPPQPLGQRQRQRRLAAAGRPGDDQGRRRIDARPLATCARAATVRRLPEPAADDPRPHPRRRPRPRPRSPRPLIARVRDAMQGGAADDPLARRGRRHPLPRPPDLGRGARGARRRADRRHRASRTAAASAC